MVIVLTNTIRQKVEEYPEIRIRRLMNVIVNQMVLFIKSKLMPLNILTNSFENVSLKCLKSRLKMKYYAVWKFWNV